MSTIKQTHQIFGREAKDQREAALAPTIQGAYAALETFYYAFNQRSLTVFDAVWAQHDLIQLNNPLGGMQRGHQLIHDLYQQIFEGPAQVWVELYDVVEYSAEETAVFAGRERGEFTLNGTTIPLNIRTTRIFHYLGTATGWRQVHHHGSIDDPDSLRHYQTAVHAKATSTPVTTVARVNVQPSALGVFQIATQTLVAARSQECNTLTCMHPLKHQPASYSMKPSTLKLPWKFIKKHNTHKPGSPLLPIY